MQKKVIYITAILIITIVSIFTFIINKKTENLITTSATLPNKKIGWGIKRAGNHEQPDLGVDNKKLLEEYERNSHGKRGR